MVQVSGRSGIINLESLSKTYRRSKGAPVKAVHDLSLSVPAGQICGLVGPNGAGKTTVLKTIAGLVSPFTGRVCLSRYDLVHERDAAMQQIGALIEGEHNVQRQLSVWDNLMRCEQRDSSGHSIQTHAERLLHELDLWEWRDDELSLLSQGMQRQIAVACVLMADSPILLLDEPTQYLDLQAAHKAEAWIRQLAHEKGTTVLLATRQPKVAQALCDRVVLMRQGHLVADRPTSELCHLLQGDYYHIRIKGQLEDRRSAWFDDLVLATEGDDTVLSGVVADQAALQGVIVKIRDLGIPLLSVTRVEPGLEELLAYLMYAPLVKLDSTLTDV